MCVCWGEGERGRKLGRFGNETMNIITCNVAQVIKTGWVKQFYFQLWLGQGHIFHLELNWNNFYPTGKARTRGNSIFILLLQQEKTKQYIDMYSTCRHDFEYCHVTVTGQIEVITWCVHTFLAANCMASCSKTWRPFILEEIISSSCLKVYGWKVKRVRPCEGEGKEKDEEGEGWKGGWRGGWMGGWRRGWMERRMEGSIKGRMEGRIKGRTERRMGGWRVG